MDDAEYHALRGNVLQTLLRLDEAETAYLAALARDPSHGAAGEGLALCQRLREGHVHGTAISPAGISMLAGAMRKQGRMAEARVTIQRLDSDADTLREAYVAVLKEGGVTLGQYDELTVNAEGMCHIKLWRHGHSNLAFLAALPLEYLHLDQCKALTDLSTLRGMPLRCLDLGSCSSVQDLAPLHGASLEWLSVAYTSVSDLSPLRGMPLKHLSLERSEVGDLSPLSKLPIESLDISDCSNVTDLSPLLGMPIKKLRVGGFYHRGLSKLDLSPVTSLPLESLHLSGASQVRDLSPFAELALRHLDLHECGNVTDLSPLAGHATLRSLNLGRTGATDLAPLRGLDLTYIGMSQVSAPGHLGAARVQNLSALKGMTNLTGMSSSDLSPLLLREAFAALEEGDTAGARQKAETVIEEWRPIKPMAPYLEEVRRFIRSLDTVEQLDKAPGTPPPQAHELGGHHYVMYPVPMTWPEAKTFCERHGGHLLTISRREDDSTTREEQLIKELWFGTTWLGAIARDGGKGGKRWITGEAWTWSGHKERWRGSIWDSLNNYTVAKRYTAPMAGWQAPTWDLAGNDAKYPFIIEWDE